MLPQMRGEDPIKAVRHSHRKHGRKQRPSKHALQPTDLTKGAREIEIERCNHDIAQKRADRRAK